MSAMKIRGGRHKSRIISGAILLVSLAVLANSQGAKPGPVAAKAAADQAQKGTAAAKPSTAAPDPQINLPHPVAVRGLLNDGNTIRINPAAVRTYLAGSASLTHGAIAGNGGCANRDIPVTGATVGDRVVVGAPAELLTYPLALTYAVSAADTVTIRLCNYTSSKVTPPSWTWNVDVVKSF